MDMKIRIKELCAKKGISMNKLEDELSFGKGYISKLGSSTPNMTKIKKIADYFNVSIDFLMGSTESITCEECDFTYYPLEENDLLDHEERHHKWELAESKFGQIFNHAQREDIKSRRNDVINCPSSSLKEKIQVCDLLFRAYFSRSLNGSNFNLNHPDIETYSSMLLNQDYWKNELPIDVYKAMLKKYGTRPGIENRKTYYDTNRFISDDSSDYAYQEVINYAIKNGYTPEDIKLALEMLNLAKKANK